MRKIHIALGAGALVLGAKLAGDLAVRRHEDLKLEDTLPSGRIAWLNGLRIHYLDQGSGPPLVFLHGLGASNYSFRHNLPELARTFRVIVPDLPGYGLSSRDVPDLSMTAQTLYLAAFLDQLGIERATLAGHSMGGSIAQRFAVMFPHRVDGLILIASTTDEFMRRGAIASSLLAPFIPVFIATVMLNPVLRERWVRQMVHDPAYLTTEIRANYAAPGHIIGHVAAYQRLMLDRARDEPIDLASIRAKALIVWGESDRVVSIDHGRLLDRAIPDSRMAVVPQAGHWVPEEQPGAVNALIAGFLTPPAPAVRRRRRTQSA